MLTFLFYFFYLRYKHLSPLCREISIGYLLDLDSGLLPKFSAAYWCLSGVSSWLPKYDIFQNEYILCVEVPPLFLLESDFNLLLAFSPTVFSHIQSQIWTSVPSSVT